ncbi:hypothetical protein [Ruegeria arenilitoris]|uniref:hypothetical protein n=1 Tax=Ruegeria arenilitoris TaxID=1173585 RepID=UPI00147B797E|nr:hypothetical protein [Ruegeria arenilitoris]
MFFFSNSGPVELSNDLKAFLLLGRISFGELEGFLSKCRKLRPDMTVGTLHTFIFVARRAGAGEREHLTLAEVASGLSISYPTAARHCDILSTGIKGREGLGWIHKDADKRTRQKYLYLSPSGVSVLEEFARNSTAQES